MCPIFWHLLLFCLSLISIILSFYPIDCPICLSYLPVIIFLKISQFYLFVLSVILSVSVLFLSSLSIHLIVLPVKLLESLVSYSGCLSLNLFLYILFYLSILSACPILYFICRSNLSIYLSPLHIFHYVCVLCLFDLYVLYVYLEKSYECYYICLNYLLFYWPFLFAYHVFHSL